MWAWKLLVLLIIFVLICPRKLALSAAIETITSSSSVEKTSSSSADVTPAGGREAADGLAPNLPKGSKAVANGKPTSRDNGQTATTVSTSANGNPTLRDNEQAATTESTSVSPLPTPEISTTPPKSTTRPKAKQQSTSTTSSTPEPSTEPSEITSTTTSPPFTTPTAPTTAITTTTSKSSVQDDIEKGAIGEGSNIGKPRRKDPDKDQFGATPKDGARGHPDTKDKTRTQKPHNTHEERKPCGPGKISCPRPENEPHKTECCLDETLGEYCCSPEAPKDHKPPTKNSADRFQSSIVLPASIFMVIVIRFLPNSA